jgi:hypothetical protein
MLEEGMLQSLEDHFTYWDGKVEDINVNADEALLDLRHNHKVYHEKYRNFMENVKRLTPYSKNETEYLDKIELMLQNSFK